MPTITIFHLYIKKKKMICWDESWIPSTIRSCQLLHHWIIKFQNCVVFSPTRIQTSRELQLQKLTFVGLYIISCDGSHGKDSYINIKSKNWVMRIYHENNFVYRLSISNYLESYFEFPARLFFGSDYSWWK